MNSDWIKKLCYQSLSDESTLIDDNESTLTDDNESTLTGDVES